MKAGLVLLIVLSAGSPIGYIMDQRLEKKRRLVYNTAMVVKDALDEFRKNRGTYPDSLDELVPEYIQ